VTSVRDLLEMAMRSDGEGWQGVFLSCLLRRGPARAWPPALPPDLDKEGAQPGQDHAQDHAPGGRLAQE